MKALFESLREAITKKDLPEFKKAHIYLRSKLTTLVITYASNFTIPKDVRDELSSLLTHFFWEGGPLWPEVDREMGQLEILSEVIEGLVLFRTPEQLKAVVRDKESMWEILVLLKENGNSGKSLLRAKDIRKKTKIKLSQVEKSLHYFSQYGIIRHLPPMYEPYIQLTSFGETLI